MRNTPEGNRRIRDIEKWRFLAKCGVALKFAGYKHWSTEGILRELNNDINVLWYGQGQP